MRWLPSRVSAQRTEVVTDFLLKYFVRCIAFELLQVMQRR